MTGVGTVEYLRRLVGQRIAQEGLRPFSRRTCIPVGQLRSLVHGRAIHSTRLESIASALDLQFCIGPPRADCAVPPRLPPEIARALDLPGYATVADAVAAIDKDVLASSLREGLGMLRDLLDCAAARRPASSRVDRV